MQANAKCLPAIVNCFLVLAITLHRLLLFSKPTRTASHRTAAIVSGAVWIFAAILLGVFLGCFGIEAEFDNKIGTCVSAIERNATEASLIVISLMIFVPLLLIILFNLIICYIVFKRGTSTQDCMRGIMLTCLLSGVFIASWTPYIAKCLITLIGQSVIPELDFFAYNCVSINTFANPILYSLTNQRFRKYVISGVREKTGMLCCFITRQSEEIPMGTMVQTRNACHN